MSCPTSNLMGKLILKAFGSDGSTASDLELEYDNGDFTAGPFSANMKERVELKRRGQTVCIQDGDDIDPEGSFTCMLLHASDAKSAKAFALASGAFSTNTSTRGIGKRYAFHVRWEVEGTDFGEAADSYMQLDDCEATVNISEGSPNTVTIAFKCFGKVDDDGHILRAALA